MRYSREHQQETRQRLLNAAVALLRTHGLEGATLERIVAAAGLTHGAVYKHFDGKESLLREALPLAAAEFRRGLLETAAPMATDEIIDAYLSDRHRDMPEAGSPLAAVAGDMPRASTDTRAIFEREFVDFARLLRGAPGDEAPDDELAKLSLMIGGLILSRGVVSENLSNRILDACQRLAVATPGAQPLAEHGRAAWSVGDAPFATSMVDRMPRRQVSVLGTHISYVDVGSGQPVVFLNSPMFTSYCWRNVIPQVAANHRCLAPDLVGVGRSGPAVDGSYRFADQSQHVEAWLDSLALDRPVVLVGHEWGATIAFDLAARRPDRVAAVVHFGAVLSGAVDETFPAILASWHRQLRASAQGELMYEEDRMIERQYRRSTLRRMSEAELDIYRAPWREHGPQRAPLVHITLDMPIDGQPRDVVRHIDRLVDFMAASPMPKLFLRPTPGWRRVDPDLARIRSWANQTEVSLPGVLLVMEDSPDRIAGTLLAFLESHGLAEPAVEAGARLRRI